MPSALYSTSESLGAAFRPEIAGKSVVYIACNLRRMGRAYVGCSKNGLAHRRRTHLAAAKRGQPGHFYNALRKYGSDAFYWRVLRIYDDLPAALKAEREAIRCLKPYYNKTEGGEGVVGLRHSEASKQKAIVCITDGRLFPSAAAAAKSYGLTTGQISRYCKTKTARKNGLKFRYAGDLDG